MATLLFLDDDARFLQLVSPLFERRGHKVLLAGRCSEARKLLAARAVDLLVVDGLLPDGTGADFIRARRDAGLFEPALLVSSFWKKELASIARQAGAQASLAKPVQPEDLVRRAEALIGAATLPALRPEGEAELAALRSRFAGELPSLVHGVRTAVEQLRARPQAPGLFGVARRRAHQLAGTAGSFGFDAIGACCAALEDALLALQSGASDAWKRIDGAAALLRDDRSLPQASGGAA